MKKILAAGLLILGMAGSAWPRTVEGIVAVVEGAPVTLSELNQFIARSSAVPNPSLPGPDDRKRWLEFLIEDRLIEKEAEKIGVTVSEPEVDQAITELLQANSLALPDLKNLLKERGLSEAEYRREISRELIRNRVLAREIQSRVFLSEDKVRTYYLENISRFSTPPQQRISQIFISRSRPQAEERLKKLERLLQEGKDFAELAREFSDDPSRQNGGDIGYFALSELKPELREALARLPLKKPSAPVRTEEGFHLLLVTGLKAGAPTPFAEVKSQVTEELYNREVDRGFRSWLEGIKSRAKIELKPEP
ncbi:MAG: peptidyl-prolyl cis-trans isomerase [Proteobacteria bacterium]|nr:peptidyl-prolyl cis-trans isomerase [Pseudomonadota bacterium]